MTGRVALLQGTHLLAWDESGMTHRALAFQLLQSSVQPHSEAAGEAQALNLSSFLLAGCRTGQFTASAVGGPCKHLLFYDPSCLLLGSPERKIATLPSYWEGTPGFYLCLKNNFMCV